jgi:prepilin-type N-terminal cleavage/methylation domain-containing protein
MKKQRGFTRLVDFDDVTLSRTKSASSKLTTGFTLIELLVVVAIIGVLAAVIIASLNNARGEGNDSAVKSDLRNANAQAELYYNDNTDLRNSYKNVCTGTVAVDGALGIGGFISAAAKVTKATVNTDIATKGDYNLATCHVDTNGTGWAAEAPITGSASGSPMMWCVDNSGKSKSETTNLAATTGLSCK